VDLTEGDLTPPMSPVNSPSMLFSDEYVDIDIDIDTVHDGDESSIDVNYGDDDSTDVDYGMMSQNS